MEFHQSHRIKDIEIHYHSEALYGNEVQLYIDRDLENTLDYSMHRIEDDKIICRVKTHWIK